MYLLLYIQYIVAKDKDAILIFLTSVVLRSSLPSMMQIYWILHNENKKTKRYNSRLCVFCDEYDTKCIWKCVYFTELDHKLTSLSNFTQFSVQICFRATAPNSQTFLVNCFELWLITLIIFVRIATIHKYQQVTTDKWKEPQWSTAYVSPLGGTEMCRYLPAHTCRLCSSTAPSLRSSPLPPRMSCAWLAWKKMWTDSRLPFPLRFEV